MRLFEERGVVLFDAAMGTALLAAGQPKGTGSEEMNLTAPEIVLTVHLENVNAGSDVVTSNTFGVTQKMMRGETEAALGIIEKAVGIAKEAAGRGRRGPGVLTCLGIGPTGAMLGPGEALSYESALEFFALQAEAGEQAGADFILLETFSDAEEFARAVRGAKKASGLPVLGTMTFEEGGRSYMGASIPDLIRVARSEGLSAAGVNCTLDPEGMLPLVSELLSLSGDLPVIAQPNAGQPVYADGKAVYMTTDEAFAAGAEKLIALGVSGIGGCCGTTPMAISLIRDIIDRRKKI